MPVYRVDSQRSRIVVRARSSVHDTSTTWSQITGQLDADAATLDSAGATGSFQVDMMSYDAGDWLKNRKLKKDFDLPGHPTATFELQQVSDVKPAGPAASGDAPGSEAARFSATAIGLLRWRGKELTVTVRGDGQMTGDALHADGAFELDIRQLGLQPPRFLMFKVEDEVTVEITIHARAV